MISPEGILHQNVADYLKRQYPGAIFHTDFAAGCNLPIWLAVRNKRLQSGRGFPDLFIAVPMHGYHGLFIELKATSIYLKDGSLSRVTHIQEQDGMLKRLEAKDYKAVFAVGFDEAKQIIDEYLRPAIGA